MADKVKEYPVPMSENSESFDAAVKKSKMFYENIDENGEYQVAIASNGNPDHSDDIALIYTSSIDGRIHTKKLEYDKASFAKLESGEPCYKDGCISIGVEHSRELLKAVNPPQTIYHNKKGLLAHNGELLVPPQYTNMFDINNSFIFAYDAKKNMAVRDVHRLYDYDGRIWFTLTGFSWADMQHMETEDTHEEVCVLFHEAMQEVEEGLPKRKWIRAYAIYNGNVYLILERKSKLFDITTLKVKKEGLVLTTGIFNKPVLMKIKVANILTEENRIKYEDREKYSE